ncbi:hypothetical protein RRF57_006340 [Xylaria bambusicola]|uniref:Uncharacterized protein n=1 Tax=Xylaria bambusicola TaxID=326684 RepID=A0AAN7UE68_9PEZI
MAIERFNEVMIGLKVRIAVGLDSNGESRFRGAGGDLPDIRVFDEARKEFGRTYDLGKSS